MTRLPAPYGRFIDRTKPVSFRFEGRSYRGFAGDTLASALIANGVCVLARSFKYRRPRGIFGYGDLDAHALVQVADEPNVASDRLLLREGLPDIEGQNRSGGLARDLGAWPQFFKKFMPVGFYYRTFFSAAGAWDLFEPFIRKRAGLGVVRRETAHKATLKQYLFCDVAIVGAGLAGVSAARAAALAGADVLLIEVAPRLGGFASAVGDLGFCDLEAKARHDNIRILTGALAQGLFEDRWLGVESEGIYYKVRAKAVVLATGAAEQPFVFRGNDLPGVMMASAARKLLWRHGVVPGEQIAVATVNDHGLEAALDFANAGVQVVCVADAREPGARNGLHDKLQARGVKTHFSTLPYEAEPGPGSFYFGGRLAHMRFAHAPAARQGAPDPAPWDKSTICDTLLMAGGYAPMAALACHAGAGLQYDPVVESLRLQNIPEGVFIAGSLDHIHKPQDVLADGAEAGAAAAAHALSGAAAPRKAIAATPGYNHPFPVARHPKGGEFVEFDEDLVLADIENAVEDGFSHPEHLKRWSTANMGPSQGRHSALNVLRVLARKRAIAPRDIGITTVRLPTIGERFDRLAGKAYHPWRESPMERRHLERGAQMMVAGLWRRPACYDAGRSRDETIWSEARAVRKSVGLIDVSTLGKIELRGPDAALFLDRIYATPHARQAVGKSRYAVLCDDAGAILDDGVACRFAEDRFYLTTTTGQADATYRLLTWLNAQWRMNVDIAQMTGAFAAVNLTGPRARAVLAKVSGDVDLSPQAFPYLGVRMGNVAGSRARLMRVGFTGELGYEIHVGADRGAALWDALIDAGAGEGIAPFGVEAQRLLRLEKGHIIIGQDTDGLTTPDEAGLARAIPKSKAEYRGKVAIEAQRARGSRRILAGFRLPGASVPPPENCLVIEGGEIAGRVTSAAFSPVAGGVIGLAYLRPEGAAPGAKFDIRLPSGSIVMGEVAPLPFYDPQSLRQEM